MLPADQRLVAPCVPSAGRPAAGSGPAARRARRRGEGPAPARGGPSTRRSSGAEDATPGRPRRPWPGRGRSRRRGAGRRRCGRRPATGRRRRSRSRRCRGPPRGTARPAPRPCAGPAPRPPPRRRVRRPGRRTRRRPAGPACRPAAARRSGGGPTAASSWSPTAWPRLSLITLKRSRSSSRTASGVASSGARPAEGVRHPVHEQRPVRQPGQGVVERLARQALLDGASLADVADRGRPRRDLVGVRDRPADELDRGLGRRRPGGRPSRTGSRCPPRAVAPGRHARAPGRAPAPDAPSTSSGRAARRGRRRPC